MKRLVLGAAAAAIVLALASCSAVNPEAVRIAGTSISQREMDDSIRALSGNAEIRGALARNAAQRGLAAPIPEEGHGEVVTTQVAAFLLSAEAEAAGIDALGEERGMTDTPADDAAAKTEWFPGVLAPAWDALPAAPRARFAKAAGKLATLRTALNGPQPDEATARAFFEQNPDQFAGQTFEQVQAVLMQQMVQAWNQPYGTALRTSILGLDVRIDPKYGTWDTTSGFSLPAPPIAGQVAATQTATA